MRIVEFQSPILREAPKTGLVTHPVEKENLLSGIGSGFRSVPISRGARCTLMLLSIIAVAALIAPALWKGEFVQRVARTTPAEPGFVDGIQESTPGMDDTDVEFPPRPPVLRQGRSRLTGSDWSRVRSVAASSTAGCLGLTLATDSTLANLQPLPDGAHAVSALRLRI